MKIIAVLSFIILSFSTVLCAFDQLENEKCSPSAGVNGVCLEATKCEAFKTQRNKLKICSFNNRVPIVCCPLSGLSIKIEKRISAKKCDEYLELIKTSTAARLARSVKLPSGDDNFYQITFVGGTRAEYNEFPHMSAIGWTRGNNKIDWMCGGSLISEKFVLSAAHCTLVGRERPDVIRIGDQDLLKNENGINPQEIKIKNIIVHPQYKHSLKYHDLALFELSSPAAFTNDVSPACLHQRIDDPTETVEAMGYGQTSFAGPQSNALLKGFLTIVDNSKCNEAYGHDSSDLPQGITQMQICAWDPEGNRDTCQGDSGGPLQITKFTKTNKKYYEIIGVTSFGKFCAAGSPGVYVRVYSYLDWIESIVWQ